jgi:hypothetical protein
MLRGVGFTDLQILDLPEECHCSIKRRSGLVMILPSMILSSMILSLAMITASQRRQNHRGQNHENRKSVCPTRA